MYVKKYAQYIVLVLINTVSIALLPPSSKTNELLNPSPLIPSDSVLSGYNYYKAPERFLKYNEVCFLAAHNAHCSSFYGYLYYQQTKSILELLDFGVRGLLLDTYPVKKTDLTTKASPAEDESLDGYEVMLWHSITGHDLKITYKSVLTNEILPFLKANPSEIVTVVLEDYCPESGRLNDTIVDRAGIGTYVLKPSDWDPITKNGWPTLQWMIANNKRLVIFTDAKQAYKSRYMYPQWRNMAENLFGTFDFNRASGERDDSQSTIAKKYLLSINYFSAFSTEADPGYLSNKHNTDDIAHLINKIYTDGLGGKYKNRYPNFINLDYVDKGNGLAICNFINKSSSQRTDRASTIFRPLE